jgi:hypothetical protein
MSLAPGVPASEELPLVLPSSSEGEGRTGVASAGLGEILDVAVSWFAA